MSDCLFCTRYPGQCPDHNWSETKILLAIKNGEPVSGDVKLEMQVINLIKRGLILPGSDSNSKMTITQLGLDELEDINV